jgi:hypothetical protein
MANSDIFSLKYGDLGPFSPTEKKLCMNLQATFASKETPILSLYFLDALNIIVMTSQQRVLQKMCDIKNLKKFSQKVRKISQIHTK